MAIKGKNRTKNRTKHVARAPRREPVVVKPPLFNRRWVQITAAFVVGFFVMMLLVWVTNNLRADRISNDADAAASKRRTAATAWQAEVESETGKIGTAGQQGGPPTVFESMSTALDGMKKGKPPKDAAVTLKSASDDAAAFVSALTKFDLTTTITNHGLSALQATTFTDSKDRLITSIGLYQRAADVGAQALEATGSQADALTTIAVGLRDSAQTQLQQAWTDYTEALVAGGIYVSAPQQVPAP